MTLLPEGPHIPMDDVTVHRSTQDTQHMQIDVIVTYSGIIVQE